MISSILLLMVNVLANVGSVIKYMDYNEITTNPAVSNVVMKYGSHWNRDDLSGPVMFPTYLICDLHMYR